MAENEDDVALSRFFKVFLSETASESMVHIFFSLIFPSFTIVTSKSLDFLGSSSIS